MRRPKNVRFFKINVHHIKVAMALQCQNLAMGEIDEALILEPWVYWDRIKGLCI